MISIRNGHTTFRGDEATLKIEACIVIFGLANLFKRDPGEFGVELINTIIQSVRNKEDAGSGHRD